MPECDTCSEHVSQRFESVFADERGRVLACPSCSANAGIEEVARDRAHDAERVGGGLGAAFGANRGGESA